MVYSTTNRGASWSPLLNQPGAGIVFLFPKTATSLAVDGQGRLYAGVSDAVPFPLTAPAQRPGLPQRRPRCHVGAGGQLADAKGIDSVVVDPERRRHALRGQRRQ